MKILITLLLFSTLSISGKAQIFTFPELSNLLKQKVSDIDDALVLKGYHFSKKEISSFDQESHYFYVKGNLETLSLIVLTTWNAKKEINYSIQFITPKADDILVLRKYAIMNKFSKQSESNPNESVKYNNNSLENPLEVIFKNFEENNKPQYSIIIYPYLNKVEIDIVKKIISENNH
jgi:dipeptide/tripeptide permease